MRIISDIALPGAPSFAKRESVGISGIRIYRTSMRADYMRMGYALLDVSLMAAISLTGFWYNSPHRMHYAPSNIAPPQPPPRRTPHPPHTAPDWERT